MIIVVIFVLTAFMKNATLEPDTHKSTTYPSNPSLVIDDNLWPMDICPQNTCKDRCGSILEDCGKHECNCDHRCLIFNDCCPDFKDTCPVEAALLNESELDIYSKLLPYMTLDPIMEQVHVLLVSLCPSNTDINLTEKCEILPAFSLSTYLRYVPVFSNGYVFKNKYCALCHDVTPGNESFVLGVSCAYHFNTLIKEAAMFNDLEKVFYIIEQPKSECVIKYPRNKYPYLSRRFVHTYEVPKENCPAIGFEMATEEMETLALKCANYKSLISIHDGSKIVTYKNPHCALCNHNLTDTIQQGAYECGSKRCFYNQFSASSFSLLVNFNPSTDGHFLDFKTSPVSCHFGHIWDDITEECRLVKCPVGSVSNGSSCFQYYRSVPQVFEGNIQELVTFVYGGFMTQDKTDEVMFALIQYMKSNDYVVSLSRSYECKSLPIRGDVLLFEHLNQKNISRQVFCIAIVFKPSFEVWFQTLFDMMLAPMHDVNVRLQKILFYNFDLSRNLECDRGRAVETGDVILHKVGLSQNVYVPNVGFYGPLSYIPLMLSYNVNNDERMQLATELKSTVLMCVDDQDPVSVESLIGLTIMETITIIGNAISIFALLLTFFSLCFFSSLKGTFRILFINLTISLFIAQTTFMFQDIFISYQILCLSIAIFHHYAWLSYFFLMNSIAFEVALKFRSLNSLTKARCNLVHKDKLACLLVYGWVTPLFLVITGVVLDFVENSQFSPQYGKGTACWINNPTALLAFFVIPFSCIVCLKDRLL